MKNRSRYEVIAAILKSVGKEETRTKIMYKAMLSNDQCKLYLDSLIKSGLVQELNNGDKMLYKITPKGGRFLSYYDQTKYESHQVALDRIRKGAPIVIVQPGGVYGPGDHSEIGNVIDQARTGKLFALPFPETGLNLVHVDDVADGVILAYERGEVGQSYVLGGEIATMRGMVDKVAEIASFMLGG